MRALVLVPVLLMVAFLASAHGVDEYAEILRDASRIAVDARQLYMDLANDHAAMTAAGDVVDAWGHVKAAVAVLKHGHDGRGKAAAGELAQAVTSVHRAYQALEDDEGLTDARNQVVHILQAVADLVYDLRGGNVGESCSSRCAHECSGLDVASCALNCVHGHSCEPHCCGCKDGTPSCQSCGANCGQGVGALRQDGCLPV